MTDILPLEVKYYPIDRWGWECPECRDWNEEEENPAYRINLECNGCNKTRKWKFWSGILRCDYQQFNRRR